MLKGKLLFDLSEAGFSCQTLPAALDAIESTVKRIDSLWTDISPWPTAGGFR